MLQSPKAKTRAALLIACTGLCSACGSSDFADLDGTDPSGTDRDGSGGGSTDQSDASGGASSGGASSDGGGYGGDAENGGTGSGGSETIPDNCFRPYICVDQCGSKGDNYGCQPCPQDKIDNLHCPEESTSTGLEGTVNFLEGNHQPDTGASSGTTTPVAREIRIYLPVTENYLTEATDRSDGAYAVYSKVQGTLVGKANSSEQGAYSVALSPGTYSVFVEDEGDWYCNHQSSEGFCLVEVADTETLSEYDIDINYAAVF